MFLESSRVSYRCSVLPQIKNMYPLLISVSAHDHTTDSRSELGPQARHIGCTLLRDELNAETKCHGTIVKHTSETHNGPIILKHTGLQNNHLNPGTYCISYTKLPHRTQSEGLRELNWNSHNTILQSVLSGAM